MSRTVGQIIDSVASVVVTRSNAVERQRIFELIQEAYYELAQKTSWVVLRKQKTLAFNATTSKEILLPADLIGIDAVLGDETTGYRPYLPRDEYDVDYDETTFRYFFSEIIDEPVAQGSDLQIAQGDTTFEADSLTTDYTGDFIVFGTIPGYHELSASKEISRTYYGQSLSDEYYQIRPPGTKKISAVTSSRQATTETLTCHYWRFPPPLYRETDMILIPAERSLELMVMIRYVGERHKQSFRANEFKQELYGVQGDGEDGELARAIKSNPEFNAPTVKKNRQGNIFDMGANNLASRTGISNDNLPGSGPWRGYFGR